MSADNVAALRIELLDIEPLIWRRVTVGTATNLQTLHRIIQAAMGWQDYHLWEFLAGDKTYGVPDPDDAGWGHKVYRAGGMTLARLIAGGLTSFDYTYDMDDNWEHRITIAQVGAAEPDKHYPDFLGGERRCPPEDCGSTASPDITSSSTSSLGPTRARAAAARRKCSTGTAAPTISA